MLTALTIAAAIGIIITLCVYATCVVGGRADDWAEAEQEARRGT